MIAAFVDLTWDRHPDITAVVVAVDQGNEASWRALEGAAFLRPGPGCSVPTTPAIRAPATSTCDAGPQGEVSADRTPVAVSGRPTARHEGHGAVHPEALQLFQRRRAQVRGHGDDERGRIATRRGHRRPRRLQQSRQLRTAGRFTPSATRPPVRPFWARSLRR